MLLVRWFHSVGRECQSFASDHDDELGLEASTWRLRNGQETSLGPWEEHSQCILDRLDVPYSELGWDPGRIRGHRTASPI